MAKKKGSKTLREQGKAPKESAVKRWTSFGKKYPLTTLTEIQSAYAKKDIKRIRILTNDNKYSDDYQLAKGRLATGYLNNVIDKPFQKTKKIVFKQTGIKLTNDYKTNLKLMGNTKITTIGPPIKPPKNLLEQILSRNGLGIVSDLGGGKYRTTISRGIYVLDYIMQQIRLSQDEINFLHAQGIYYWRCVYKIKFNSGNLGYLSTPYLELSENFEAITDYIEEAIIQQSYYEYQEVFELLESVEGIIINWS